MMKGIVAKARKWFGSDKPVLALPEGEPVRATTAQQLPSGAAAAETVLPAAGDADFSETAPTSGSALVQSLDFLRRVARARLRFHFGKTKNFEHPKFNFPDDQSEFARFVINKQLSVDQFILLTLAVSPHVHPDLFSGIVGEFLPRGGEFPEFGGVKSTNGRSLLPTGDTALFLLAGMHLDHRAELQRRLLSSKNPLFKDGVLAIQAADQEPLMNGRLLLSKEYVSLFLTEEPWRPGFSASFPAKLLTTQMDWQTDLVLPATTEKDLAQLDQWLACYRELGQDAQLGRKLKPGYRALFYGPPGTGKTLTASLLGQKHGLDVYRIDLSQVVSKYIGETEKNLQSVFDTAEHKNWILFFDEADALFGKRTATSSSHDRYANQEVSYLLQRVEDHDGLVVLASNLKANLDQAFMRRFQSVVYFPLPDVAERQKLWEKTLPVSIGIAADVRPEELAKQFEMTGAAILNVVHASSIRALSEKRDIQRSDIIEHVRKEFQKEGKTI